MSRERRLHLGGLGQLGLRTRAEHDGARDRTRQDEPGEEEKPLTRPVEQGQDERRDEAADRDRGLANSECEPALVRAEPPHHRAPTPRLDAAARHAREREQQRRAMR